MDEHITQRRTAGSVPSSLPTSDSKDKSQHKQQKRVHLPPEDEVEDSSKERSGGHDKGKTSPSGDLISGPSRVRAHQPLPHGLHCLSTAPDQRHRSHVRVHTSRRDQ
eukprot:scaffold30730_cov32-Prasinocladus_malaysianus.AAC.1